MTREETDQRRADFVAGVDWSRQLSDSAVRELAHAQAELEAAKRFPYPTQPRVVTLRGWDFRVLNGRLERRATTHGPWQRANMDPEEVRAVADLLDRPNEEAS